MRRNAQARPARALRLTPLAQAALLLAAPLWLQAQAAPALPNVLPGGLQVTAGRATVSTQGASMTVRNTPGAILNWQSFSIGSGNAVWFEQANAASKVLNRVTGSDPSVILGSLGSNGQVWLLNPYGVLFGAGARVDVAGLVTGTLRLNDNDFLAGRYRFDALAGDRGLVRNEGRISTSFGGQVVLLGSRVENAGEINATGGAVALAAASSVDLVDTGLPNLAVRVNKPAGEALNLGRLVADGGRVDVYAAIVNQQGWVQADTLRTDSTGQVVLRADDTLTLGASSTTRAVGTSAGSAGGNVDLLGAQVAITGQAVVDVSGAALGGGIRAGGGAMGRDASVPNARALWFGDAATLRADATGAAGNGGRIVLWSDAATRAYGTLSAHGGSAGGDGGFIETSGGWLDARPARIDLSSRGGRAGSWLLDPNDITIVDGGTDTNISGGPVFTSTNDASVLSIATLAAALNAGTSVTVSTGSGGTNAQAGDIVMNGASLSVNPSADVTLTLAAARDILVRGSSLTATGHALGVNLVAAGSGIGAIEVRNATIITNGGDLTLGGALQQTLAGPGSSSLTVRPAVGYLAGAQPQPSQLARPQDGIDILDSGINLGGGSFKATGVGLSGSSDSVGVRVGSATGVGGTLMSAANIDLHGWAAGGSTSRGVQVSGASIVEATQSLVVFGNGNGWGVDSGQGGARLSLSAPGNASAVADLYGVGLNQAGLYIQDGSASGAVGGSPLVVVGGSATLTGSAGLSAPGLWVDGGGSLGSPLPAAPTLDLAAAASASFNGGSFTDGIRFTRVRVAAPAGSSAFIAPTSRIAFEQVDLGGRGSLSFQAPQTEISVSSITADGAALNMAFATTGASPVGVHLSNSIVTTGNGNVRFGADQIVCSANLGCTSVAAPWLEASTSDLGYAGTSIPAALWIEGSTIEAGTGRIFGGGAGSNPTGGTTAGVTIDASVLRAREVSLAGRSENESGINVALSTISTDRLLNLDAVTATPGFLALAVVQGSDLRVIDPGTNSGSAMHLSGSTLSSGSAVEISGGAVGSGTETTLTVSGASLTIDAAGNGSGPSLKMAGNSAAPGGLLIDALGATAITINAVNVSSAANARALAMSDMTLLGPQASTTSPINVVARGGAAGGAATTTLTGLTLSSAGPVTFTTDALSITSSRLAGDAGLSLLTDTSAATGRGAAPVRINASTLAADGPGALLRIQGTQGDGVRGDGSLDSGQGLTLIDSTLQARGAGGLITLAGQGAASGGSGIVFTRTAMTGSSISLNGTAQVAGDGVFSEDFGGGNLSLITATDLGIVGFSADGTVAPSHAGVRLGNGVALALSGRGTVDIQGDSVVLGSATGSQPFRAEGDAAVFRVSTIDSMRVRNATLDFSGGSGTAVTLQADLDATGGGRVRLEQSGILTGGGDFTASGVGVLRNLPGYPARNNTVGEGATGLLLTDVTIDAGGGNASLSGTAPNDGNPTGATSGGIGFAASGANSISAGTIALSGDAGDLGNGIDVSLGATLNLVAGQINVLARSAGIDPDSGAPLPALTLSSTSLWTAGSGTLDISSSAGGISLGGGATITAGPLTVGSAGALTLDNLSLTGSDVGLSAAGTGINGSLLSVANSSLQSSGPLRLDASATGGGNAISLLGGVAITGDSIAIAGQANGAPAVVFNDPAATSTMVATNTLDVSGRTSLGAGIDFQGGWTLQAQAMTLATDTALGLPTRGPVPLLQASRALLVAVSTPDGVTLGTGQEIDPALLGSAVSPMPGSAMLSIESVGAPTSAINVAEPLAVPSRLQLLADSVTLDSSALLTSNAAADAIVIRGSSSPLAAVFTNNAGGSVFNTPNGRWLVLAADPRSSTLGGLSPDFSAYNLAAIAWLADGNGNLGTPAPGNGVGWGVSPALLTGKALGGQLPDKLYDAGTGIALNAGTWSVTGLLPGDTLAVSGKASGTLPDKNVGTSRAVTPDVGAVFGVTDGNGRPVFGYELPAFTANVTPLAVSLTGAAVASKVYDADTTATLASLGSVTPLAGDTLGVGGTIVANFGEKNVGTGKTVSVSGFALTGADAGNYTLVAPTTLTGDITARPISVSGLSALSRVYDTGSVAPLAGTASIAPLAGDTLTLAGTAAGAFADKNAGTAKAVTVSGLSLAGTDATNYTLQPVAGLSADITAAPLVVTGLSALARVYDGTTAAPLAGSATITPLAGDTVTLAGSAAGAFANKNVGTAKAVTVSGLSLAGTDAANYSLQAPAGLGADVTPLSVTLAGAAVATKVYDAGTGATLASLGSVTPVPGDVLGVGGTIVATFSDKNVGSGKTVSVSGFTLTGADAGNYTLVAPPTLPGTISALPITVTGLSALSRVYDTTTVAPLAGTASIAPLAGDVLSLAGSAAGAFADKNVGTGKAVSVSGLGLAGSDAANYALQPVAGLAANVSAAPLAVTGLGAAARIYDGTTAAPLTGSAAITPLAGDSVTLAGTAAGSFASKTVGTGKAVTVSGLSLAGTDAANYSLQPPTTLAADVTARTLTLQGLAAAGKVYDANTSAVLSGSLGNVVAGDGVTLNLSGTFADRNAGTGKTVNYSAAIAGADAANYVLPGATGTLSASITPATLSYVATPAFGTAGQALPLLTGTVSGFVGGETLAGATTGTLAWITSAGSASPAGRYAIDGSGLAAANYTFVQAATNATALTLNPAATNDPATNSTTVATTSAITAVQIPVAMSTPTQGRVLDVTLSLAPKAPAAGAAGAAGGGGGDAAASAAIAAAAAAGLPDAAQLARALSAMSVGEADGGVAFRTLDISRLPRDEVQTLLAARARYKQKIFASSISRLQQDPSLADVRACRNETELASGECVITAQLKAEIQADRAAAQATAAAAPRARSEGLRRVKVAALPAIERKLALLIGVNRYADKRVPALEGAVPDARAVRTLLESRLGYEATVLEDPSREAIVRAFNKLALEAQPNDSVIVYYAGHGVLVPVDNVDTGFWLPSDADAEKPGSWLANGDIARMIAAVGARQLMLVSDSCYSGALAGRDRVQLAGGENNADEMLKRKAAVIMSSGGDEPVSDEGRDGHSIFAWHFMQALQGLDRWQPGNNLYERVRAAVSKDFPQTPQYGAARTAGHQGNTDYLFERREFEAAAKP